MRAVIWCHRSWRQDRVQGLGYAGVFDVQGPHGSCLRRRTELRLLGYCGGCRRGPGWRVATRGEEGGPGEATPDGHRVVTSRHGWGASLPGRDTPRSLPPAPAPAPPLAPTGASSPAPCPLSHARHQSLPLTPPPAPPHTGPCPCPAPPPTPTLALSRAPCPLSPAPSPAQEPAPVLPRPKLRPRPYPSVPCAAAVIQGSGAGLPAAPASVFRPRARVVRPASGT